MKTIYMTRKVKLFGFVLLAFAVLYFAGCNNAAEDEVKEQVITYDATTGVGSINGEASFKMIPIASVTNGSIGHADFGDNDVHTVSLTAYSIGETEVTQELWKAVMGKNPSLFNNTGMQYAEEPHEEDDPKFDTDPASGEVQKNRPVERINWYQAISFCNKLSIKLGLEPCYTVTVDGIPVDFAALAYDDIPKANNLASAAWNDAVLDMSKNGFRLPTEAEWEWAAKGGVNDKWAGTSDEDKLKEYAWYNNDSGGDAGMKTHEIKKKKPNGYGLFDMSGNVFEWCWDWMTTETPTGGLTDPTGEVPAESGYRKNRIARGGCWALESNAMSCAYRFAPYLDDMTPLTGLRLVKR